MKIGFRIPGRAKELGFEELCRWATSTGFQSIDLSTPDPEQINSARAAGLEIGTIDLPGTRDMISADPAKQSAGVEAARAAIAATADNGCNRMFCVFVPEDHSRKRSETFQVWKATFPGVAAF